MFEWTYKPKRGKGWTQLGDMDALMNLPKPVPVSPEVARLVEACGVPQLQRNVGAFVALVGTEVDDVREAVKGLLGGLAVGAGAYTLLLVG